MYVNFICGLFQLCLGDCNFWCLCVCTVCVTGRLAVDWDLYWTKIELNWIIPRVLISASTSRRTVTQYLLPSLWLLSFLFRSRLALNFWCRNYFFLILAHPVYKMWIIQEPSSLELWNKLHFEEEKNVEYIPCLKYSVPIFV